MTRHSLNPVIRCALACLFMPIACSVYAHEVVDQPGSLRGGPLQDAIVSTTAVLSAKAGEDASEQPYPSGVLISEESRYLDNGLHADTFSLQWQQPLSQSTWVSLGVSQHGGAHGNGKGHGPELEKLALQYQRTTSAERTWQIGLGRQSAAPLEWLGWHADNPVESVAPLLADVLFARHSVDTGVRFDWLSGQTSLGLGLWNGDAWPGSPGEGAADISLRHRVLIGNVKLGVTGFAHAARADGRGAGDDDHAHGAERIPIGFSGTTRTLGLDLDAQFETGGVLDWNAGAAFITSEQEGDLQANAQSSSLTSNTDGVRLLGVAGVWLQNLPSLRWHAAVQRNYDGARAGLSLLLGVQYRYDIVLPK